MVGRRQDRREAGGDARTATFASRGLMSRNLTLAIGALLWVSFAVVAIVHAYVGDWQGPVAAGIIVATTVALYHGVRRARRRALEPS